MAASMRIAVIAFFLFIWSSLNFYLGWRGWQYFGSHNSAFKIFYWGMLIFLTASYFIGRWANQNYPGHISDSLIWIGSYWMAFFIYALLFNVLFDMIRYTDKVWGFLPPLFHGSASTIVIIFLLLIVSGLVYGTYNANRSVVRQYQVNIPKQAGTREGLHIVMVSDTHLGSIVGRNRLIALANRVNLMQPEIVLLVGDIIDGDVRPFEEQHMAEVMRTINAPLGVYAVLGNHEYLGGQYKELIDALKSCGITVLRDQYIQVDNFYLVGRDDKFSRLRRPLREVIAGLNHQYPIILMDHNPIDIKESESNQVDLQLSGHTHAGQLFPLNLFTKKIFVLDWGYLRQGHLQVIVSDGFGTWGPPIRIGNRPEIVEIFVKFGNNE